MKKTLSLIILLLLTSSCAPLQHKAVPVGSIPSAKAPSAADEQYGHELLTQFRQKWSLANNHPRLDEVDRIIDRLTYAAFAEKYPWHVYVFEDKNFKNAAATRGNHIFVWTAMIDSTKNEDELATVLAHEISHVLAGHVEPDVNESLAQALIGITASVAGSAIASSSRGGLTLGRLTSSLTQEVASGVFINPYTREKEYEADQVGFFLMAEAGYNPEAAIGFWKRAQNDPSFSSSLEFFSTHPPALGRLSRLESYLPSARDRYLSKKRY